MNSRLVELKKLHVSPLHMRAEKNHISSNAWRGSLRLIPKRDDFAAWMVARYDHHSSYMARSSQSNCSGSGGLLT